MRLLLDTNAWLRLTSNPRRLSSDAARALSDAENELYLSAASTWEMAIKAGLGKLRLPEPVLSYQVSRMARHAVRGLPIEHVHVARLADMPQHHRDPFDRLLLAQAEMMGLTFVTGDEGLAVYGVPLMLT
jgi:PIN domain nuclease of toxin-antitoxin system